MFTIKGVKTGKTFEAVRWSGYNHLDAEPRTSEDTATMKAIYGGSWSWSRRAILILYNGHVYAASMNGMPHGTSTINNDFSGHFCIHFLNSRTHETDRVVRTTKRRANGQPRYLVTASSAGASFHGRRLFIGAAGRRLHGCARRQPASAARQLGAHRRP